MTDKKKKGKKRKAVAIAAGSAFIGTAGVRNAETKLRWNGAQMILVLNIPGLFTVLYRLSVVPATRELVIIAFGCFVAALFNLEWYKVLKRDGKLLDYWNKKLLELELKNGTDGDVRIFSDPEYIRICNSSNRLQHRLIGVTVALIYAWSILGVAISAWVGRGVLS